MAISLRLRFFSVQGFVLFISNGIVTHAINEPRRRIWGGLTLFVRSGIARSTMTTLVSCQSTGNIRADSERWSTLKREWEGSRHNETKVDPVDAQLSFFARDGGCANGAEVAFPEKGYPLEFENSFGILLLAWQMIHDGFCSLRRTNRTMIESNLLLHDSVVSPCYLYNVAISTAQ